MNRTFVIDQKSNNRWVKNENTSPVDTSLKKHRKIKKPSNNIVTSSVNFSRSPDPDLNNPFNK